MRKSKDKKTFLLKKKLGPDLVSNRAGFGSTTLTYVEGWLVIDIANKIFGYDGWNFEIKKLEIEYTNKDNGRFSIGCSCHCRVTLLNESKCFREDIGFGSCENARLMSIAYEKARKEAVTDGLKRAFRQLGSVFGNCLYDKNYCNYLQKKKGKSFNYKISEKDILGLQELNKLDEYIEVENCSLENEMDFFTQEN